MNIIDIQERLKDMPEQALMQEMQMPTGTAPQFLVLGELKRRKRMRDDYQRMQASDMKTVAEEAVTAAGMPQAGIMSVAQSMAPRSAIAQNTGVNDMMEREATRAPQPEQPMMMADGGYVQRMQEGGFTGPQQQSYLIFLDSMGLQDSPQSRDMYVRMMERQKERGVSPQTFTPFMDRPPESISISDVGADLDAFIPGAEAAPPMMAAPALGPAPIADTIDFDASVAELPPTEEELFNERLSGMTAAELLAASAAEQGLSAASVAALNAKPTEAESGPEVEPDGPTYPGWGANTDMTPYQSLSELRRFLRGDYGGDNSPAPNDAELMSGLPPEDIERLKTAPPEASDTAPPQATTSQGLSFGLPPADLPTTGAELSFGGITPSAADIPLSIGREGAVEPTPEFPLGTPVEAPAAAVSSTSNGGTGGAGGAGGGAYGGIESRIARMLEERERSAQADKWLALAQTGLALMASNQPTIGGAIGEAGLAGIGAMQKARSEYDKDIMSLLDAQAGLQRARASGARTSSTTAGLSGMIDDARQELTALNAEARSYRDISTDPITGEPRLVDMTPPGLQARIVAVEDRLAQLNALRSGSASTAQFDATAQ